METRTNYPHIDYRTQLQWAKDGKIVNSDSVGIRMWTFLCKSANKTPPGQILLVFWPGVV